MNACQCKTGVDAVEQRNRDLAVLSVPAGGLVEQLAAEKASRQQDGDTIAIEAVIQKSGVTFEAPQQTLGRAVLALFCGTATSPDGFTITQCEYPTVEQASRGAVGIKAIRGATSGWSFKARKKSTLEVVARSDAKKESVDAVLSAFDAL